MSSDQLVHEDQLNTEQQDDQQDIQVDESSQTETPKETPQVDTYQPNLTYRIYEEERKFPDRVASLIKSKEDEEFFRDLYTKADGLPQVKEKLEKQRSRSEEYESRYSDLQAKVNKLQHFAQNDVGAFLQIANIPKEKVFDWVKREIEILERDPSERHAYEESRKRNVEYYDVAQQKEQLERFNNELLTRQHNFELQQALTMPEISTFEKEFDSRLGPGKFRDHVQTYGNTQWLTSQKYVSPIEAVQAVYNQYKPLFQLTPQPTHQPTIQPQVQPKPQQATLPNVGQGRNVSPTGKTVRNLDDLRALARKMSEEDEAVNY